MTSSGFGDFDTMIVTGNQNIIKNIPVSIRQGEVIFDHTVTIMDYLDSSRQTFSAIYFESKDIFGKIW